MDVAWKDLSRVSSDVTGTEQTYSRIHDRGMDK